MKTKLHYYQIDTSTKAGQARYNALCHEIEANCPEARGRKMREIPQRRGQGLDDGQTEEVEIETAHIFENQWNATDRRVFDWWEEAHFENGRESFRVRVGHWLEITPEMAAARRDTVKCGYCGAHYGPLHGRSYPQHGFCIECLDFAYLKESDLHLLRLLPLVGHQERAPLTEEERATVLPTYVKRQTTGADSRAKARRDEQRAEVLAEYEKTTTAATEERDGLLWLWDHGMDLENVIYYSHTRKFSFGWRSPLSDSVVSALLDLMSEFPYSYEIKGEGRNYESIED